MYVASQAETFARGAQIRRGPATERVRYLGVREMRSVQGLGGEGRAGRAVAEQR